MPASTHAGSSAPVAFARVGLFALTIGILWVGRDIIIPVAVAVLVAFVLMPVVLRLEKLRVPRWLAAIGTVGMTTCLILAGGWIVAVQALDFAEALPRYRGTLREKVMALADQTDGLVAKARRGVDEVERQVSEAASALRNQAGDADPATAPDPNAAAAVTPPTPVVVSPPPREIDASSNDGPLETLAATAGTVLSPLVSIGVVLVLATIILLRREELRDRIVALAGESQLHRTTDMMDEAARQLGRLLLTQLLVGVGFGTIFAAALLVIGVPNAILFGALVVPMRFVPVIGTWISLVPPAILATIVLDGWVPPVATVGIFLVLEVLASSIVEPWALGKRTGVSMSAILLALIFWTWLWGAPGLILAMPITSSLAVLGRRVPGLDWIGTLLNEDTGLPPSARLYQRLLALDLDQALAIARAERDRSSLEETYATVMVPALLALERHRHSGEVDERRATFALEGISEIADGLALDATFIGPMEAPEAEPVAGTDPPALVSAPKSAAPRTVFVPAHGPADAIVARMFMHVLHGRGRDATALPIGDRTSERAAAAAAAGSGATICLCAVPPLAESHARQLLERVRGLVPVGRIAAALVQPKVDERSNERLTMAGAGTVVASFTDAVRALAPAASTT